MTANDRSAQTESERDGSDELEFVIQHITAVLAGHQSRQLLYELASESEAGTDLGQTIDWDVLDVAAVERLVGIAVNASMCRAMLLIIYADKRLTDREFDFVRRSMNPFVSILRSSSCSPLCPDLIRSHADTAAFSSWVRDRSPDLFAEDGVGGKASSLPRLCSLCDPFVETPLLPVFLYAVRRLCVMAANADGMSAEEQSVLDSFDRLTDRCETISRKVTARLPDVSKFDSKLNSGSSLADIQTTLRTLDGDSKERELILARSAKRSKRLESRINQNRRRNASYIFDDWNLSVAFLVLACWVFVTGIGSVAAMAFKSWAVGFILISSGLFVGTRFVVEVLLHRSWYSTTRMQAEFRDLRLRGYKAWKELINVDEEIERLDEISRPMILAAQVREAQASAEESRLQAERQRRYAAMSSYVVPRGGPIRVRSYYRRDGTFVQTHSRRRKR